MEKKSGFFKNVWTSIRDFEKYERFAADTVLHAIKYILLLTLIFTAIVALAYTYKFYTVLDSTRNYISENIKDIKIEDGKLTVAAEETPIVIENEDELVPIIIIDTSDNVNTEEYMEKINLYNMGILLLKDKAIVSSEFLLEDEEFSYSKVFSENIENKEEIIGLISGNNALEIYALFFVTILIYLFVIYFTSNLIDGLILGVLGYLFARIVKLRLVYKATYNIGLHALTLPIVLNLIYILVNTFTSFTISHFQWMYTTISYIYVAVAILMIKTEIINQRIQLIRLQKIQEKVAKEEQIDIEKPKEKEKEDKNEEEKEKKEKGEGEQPEGSNA